jgi:hypothetical protein
VQAGEAGSGRQATGLELGADEELAADAADETEASNRVALEGPAAEAAAEARDAAPKGPFLRGVVTDVDGFVIPGATLKLTGEGPTATLLNFTGSPFVERTECGSAGEYKVTRRGLLGDEVTIYVRARGYLPLEASRTVGPGAGDIWFDDLKLERGVVLGGRVVDANGAPVEGAEIRRTTPGDQDSFRRSFRFMRASTAVKSAADGSFELPNEEAGRFALIVTHDDYPRARLEGDAPYPGYEDSGLVVVFPATATIAGRIADMPVGRSGVVVHAVPSEDSSGSDTLGPMEMFMSMAGQEGGVRAKPEADGSFVVTGVDPGRAYELMATLEGGFMNQVRCSERVLALGGDDSVELAWDSGASVVFQLIDAKTQKPIKASTVNYRWETGGMRSFQIGSIKREFLSSHVELTELRPKTVPGVLVMMISAPGYLELKREAIKIDEDARVDLGKIELKPAPRVRVHVVDAVTGKGLKRGRVLLQPDVEEESEIDMMFGALNPKSQKARTESDGWCELAACATETATLTVRRSGYAEYRLKEVVMPTTRELELEVRMVEGGELAVTIVDTAGEPVGGGELTYRGPVDNRGSATASSKGRLKLKDLPAGEYQMYAKRPWETRGAVISAATGETEEPRWQRVTVVAGVKQSTTLRVPRETILVGRLTASGAPWAGATVSFVLGREGSAGGRSWRGGESTDADGHFELGKLTPGAHRLRIEATPGMPAHIVPVDLTEGDNSGDFDIEIGVITGRVVGPDGQPIAGATVTASVAMTESMDETMGLAMALLGGGSEGAKTNAAGEFELNGLPLDLEMSVAAEASGFLRTQAGEAMKAGDTGCEIQLAKSASIRVKLVGDSPGFSLIVATHEDGTTRREWAQSRNVLLEDVKPGKWTLVIDGRGDEDGPSAEVSVAESQEALVTLSY